MSSDQGHASGRLDQTVGRDGPVFSRRALLSSGAAVAVAAVAGPVAVSVASEPRRAARGGARRGRIDEVAVHRIFGDTARELRVPGCVLLVQTPDQELFASYGTGLQGAIVPLSNFDRFRVGSVTKTMTGTVILQLAQRGKLSLRDPVSRFVSGVPHGGEITIEQLMTMRSGLYDYAQSPSLNRALDEHPTARYEPRDLIRIAFRARPNPVPGGAFEYCNTNTILLGMIARRLLDGQSLPQMFRERLYEPLGMHDTVMPAIRSSAIPGPHPQGYMYGTNASTLQTFKLPPQQLKRALAGTLKPHDVTDLNPSWAGAAGAAISTLQDMATWTSGLVDGGLLNRSWQRRRLTSCRPVSPSNPAGYGLGIAKVGPLYGHGGAIQGFNSQVGRDPHRRLTIVVLANLLTSPQGKPPAATIFERIAAELYGPAFPSASQ